MTEINLLPPEYQRGGLPAMDGIIIAILSVLIIASLVGIAIGLNGKVKAHEAIANTFNKQIEPYKMQYKEIKISQNKLKDIEDRLPIIERLVGNRVLWSDKLTTIYENIPQGVWLEELQIGQDKKKKGAGAEDDWGFPSQQNSKNTQKKTEGKEAKINTLPVIHILGLAKSFVELSQFMRYFDSSPLFSEARLISASDTDFVYPSLLSFEIQARLVTH